MLNKLLEYIYSFGYAAIIYANILFVLVDKAVSSHVNNILADNHMLLSVNSCENLNVVWFC